MWAVEAAVKDEDHDKTIDEWQCSSLTRQPLRYRSSLGAKLYIVSSLIRDLTCATPLVLWIRQSVR